MITAGSLYATISEHDSLVFETRAEIAMRGFIASRAQKRADRERVEELLCEKRRSLEEDRASQISRLEITRTFRMAEAVQGIIDRCEMPLKQASSRLIALQLITQHFAASFRNL